MRNLFPNLLSGLILSFLNITYAISLAAFIFSGNIANYFPTGAGILLVATAVSAFIVAVGSSIPGVISTPKGMLCAVIAMMAASIAATVSQHQVLPTIIAAIMISSVLTGLCLFLLGSLHIGNLFRFIPYPVIGGYFAGTGLLLVKGSFPVMADVSLKFANLQVLAQNNNLILWLPGILFAILLLGAERRYKHSLIMPGLLLSGAAVFYIMLYLSGTSIAEARGIGLLLPDFISGNLLPPIGLTLFKSVNFPELSRQLPSIMAIVFLSAITALLITSAMEIGTEKDLELDRDLKVIGIANMATGLTGGVVSFHTATDTILSYKLGAKSRLTGVWYAFICGAVIFIGPSIITYFPKPVMGGLLIYQGFDLLITWAYDSRLKLPKVDYFLVITILIVITFFGFLKGVGLGIIFATVLFIVNYSRINIVKYVLSGINHKSKVARASSHQKILNEKGEQIYILVLQGYIFFGTADKLLQQIKQRLEVKDIDVEEIPPARFIVLDFRMVTNIDTSAVNSFVRIKQLARSKQVMLVFAGINASIIKQLKLVNYFDKDTDDAVCRVFRDLDHALEWCEEKLLDKEMASELIESSLSQQLTEWFSNPKVIPRFIEYLEQRFVFPGTQLFRQGDKADTLYFIESGKITILLELGKGNYIRLQTMGGGTVLGEMGLYTKTVRSATAVVRQQSTLHCLTRESFEKMQEEDPEVAAQFHQFIVCLLSDRIGRANEELKALFT